MFELGKRRWHEIRLSGKGIKIKNKKRWSFFKHIVTKGRARVGNNGGEKSSRYLFNFTVEPFWQEAIIFFYMISLRPLPPRAYIFVSTPSAAVDLIFLRPGHYYGNFLGTELQFNFVVTHELQRNRTTRFIHYAYATQSRLLMKMILKRSACIKIQFRTLLSSSVALTGFC